ncbi:hypothetical protein PLICRDRAFT_180783 [Plicaturopsis crispa FD-325 SS-3]|uniref:Uncharacterized protein n=1 Tax=Plicaturopsis crispa FD-325 SS-3 TaxID=944288 RepID=A0A0C9SVH8_PLICR|nr:hypothetical protein PLICRDRAFT_180783 [Plicaturopsis crispa FD-325 SS-3]
MEAWVGTEAPGKSFRFKRLGTQDLAKIINGSEGEDSELRMVEIVKWTAEELSLSDDSPSVGRVPLIVDAEGRTVKRVFDSKAFLQSRNKKGKGKTIEIVDGEDEDEDDDGGNNNDIDNDIDNVNVNDIVDNFNANPAPVEKHREHVDDLPVAPLPRRAAGSGDGNPAPLKRKRVDEIDVDVSKRARAPQEGTEAKRASNGDSGEKRRLVGPANSGTLGVSPQCVLARGDVSQPARPLHLPVRSHPPRRHAYHGAVDAGMHAPAGGEMRSSLHADLTSTQSPAVRSDADIEHVRARRLSRPKEPRFDYDAFADLFSSDPPPPAPLPPRPRLRSVGPVDNDADLPGGPHQMRYDGGFIDWQGNYFVPGEVPRCQSVERERVGRDEGARGLHRSSHRRSEVMQGPPRRDHTRNVPDPRGTQARHCRDLRLQDLRVKPPLGRPVRLLQDRRGIQGPKAHLGLAEDVDDDMGLREENIPRMMDYPAYRDHDGYSST